ncbi:hypothetical protein C7W88_17515 (plasmid) [Novosphingobium sp. THN1]|uniref:hypothetical protein n=1 Tax=Novosphingobium sp. THN1 TaxID=1016987 RepID=UPI000E4E364D|nr:hypothetical protein [Novosphingobium sp. THN1]AXU20832.1 hypothetical protein C7W88_17515 [Novosphingobium sp. THN1]
MKGDGMEQPMSSHLKKILDQAVRLLASGEAKSCHGNSILQMASSEHGGEYRAIAISVKGTCQQ